MKVLIALDTYFKILNSETANHYAFDGVKTIIPDANIVMVPLFESDHNMVNALLSWEKGKKVSRRATGYFNHQKDVVTGILKDDTMVIDGYATERFEHIIESSSFMLGDLISQGLDMGIKHFIISLGGTTYYDGGAGMLQAMGIRFFDRDGYLMNGVIGTKEIKDIRRIDFANMDTRLKDVKFTIIADHEFKLYGKESKAARLDIPFEDKQYIDNSIWYMAEQMKKQNIYLNASPMGGEGGGVQAVFEQMFNAVSMTSSELIFQRTYLEELLNEADIIIYGGGTRHESAGSVVVETIAQHMVKDKVYLYLCAGRQFNQMNNRQIKQVTHNFYPEVTDSTDDFKLGIQLQATIENILKTYQMKLKKK